VPGLTCRIARRATPRLPARARCLPIPANLA
jgi:hypothetical protein